MAVITTTIGTASRDYSTMALWQADLDDSGVYSASDDAVGECYADSDFSFSTFTISNGSTIGLSSITLKVAAGEGHDGTAYGGGVTIVATTNGPLLRANNSAIPIVIEGLVIDKNGYGGNSYNNINTSVTTFGWEFNRNIIHNHTGTTGSTTRVIYGSGTYSACNNIIFDVTAGASDTQTALVTNSASNRDMIVINNTCYKIDHPRSGESAWGFGASDRAGSRVMNNFGADVTGVVSGNCITENTTTVKEANASTDATASTSNDAGTAQDNLTAADEFVSTTVGAEDLKLDAASNLIDGGQDYGTTYSGANIDILGRDRDAEGDTWDIGAHEYVSVGGATPKGPLGHPLTGALGGPV
jgi:hypothetical protein